MKVTLIKGEKNISVGDLIIGGSGRKYIVSKNDEGQFTLYNLTNSLCVKQWFGSIEEMMATYFSEYEHYPKSCLELIVKAGVN